MFSIINNQENTKQHCDVLLKSVNFGKIFKILEIDNGVAKSH